MEEEKKKKEKKKKKMKKPCSLTSEDEFVFLEQPTTKQKSHHN